MCLETQTLVDGKSYKRYMCSVYDVVLYFALVPWMSVTNIQVGAGSQVLLDNVERYGLLLANSVNDTDTVQVLSRPNIGKLVEFC